METKTLLHKWKAAHLLAGQSNTVSSSIMGSFVDSLAALRNTFHKLNSIICQHCNEVFLPDSHVVRFESKKHQKKHRRRKKSRTKSILHSTQGSHNGKLQRKQKTLKISCKSCLSSTKLVLENQNIPKAKQNNVQTVSSSINLDNKLITSSSREHGSQNLKPASKSNSPAGSPKIKRKSSGFVKKLSQLLTNTSKKADKSFHNNVNNNSLLDDFLTSL